MSQGHQVLLRKNLLASGEELKGTQELHRFMFYSFYPTNKQESFVLPLHPTNEKVVDREGNSLNDQGSLNPCRKILFLTSRTEMWKIIFSLVYALLSIQLNGQPHHFHRQSKQSTFSYTETILSKTSVHIFNIFYLLQIILLARRLLFVTNNCWS